MDSTEDQTFYLSDSTLIFEGEERGPSGMDSKPVVGMPAVFRDSRPRMRESIERVTRVISNHERTLQELQLQLNNLEKKLEGTNTNLTKHMSKFESAILFQTRTESQGFCNMVERRIMELERSTQEQITQHLESVRAELQAEKMRMDHFLDESQRRTEQSQATSEQLTRNTRVQASRINSFQAGPVSVTTPSSQDHLNATGIRLDIQEQHSIRVVPTQPLRSEAKTAGRAKCAYCGKDLSATYVRRHQEQRCKRRP